MAAAILFDPTAKPEEPFEYDREPRVLEAQFGNGYKQVSGDGIQSDLIVGAELNWFNLTAAEATYIIDFFRERNRWKPILYTLPGESTQGRYRFTKMSINRHDGVYTDINIEFEEAGL